MSQSPRHRSALAPFLAGVGIVALAVLAAAPVRAQDAPRPEPSWDRAIREGIANQDQDIARSSAKAVLKRLENRVSREADLVTLYLLARAYGLTGDASSALATYGDILRMDATCYFAWRDRAVLKALAKDVAGAEADFRQAVALRPDYVEALQPLAVLLLESKRYDEGIRLLHRVLDADPTHESARMQIVDAYLDMGRHDDALAALQPLLARAPGNPALRHMKGRILAAKGDTAGAFAVYEQIAKEYPDQTAPLRGWLAVAAKAPSIDPDKAIEVMEHLQRLSSDPEEKKNLAAQVDRLRRQAAGAAVSGAAPSPEAVARQLRDADPKARERALLFLLLAANETFTIQGDLLVALVERLDPAREPSPAGRALALGVFEKWADAQVAPVVRGSLRDPDVRVRCRAADVLRAMRTPFAVAALAPHAVGQDAELATSARQAIYALAKATPPAAEETPQAQAAAFQAWWKGPDARDAKIKAIEAVTSSADLAPDELVFRFVLDEDPQVWAAAYHGLRLLQRAAQGASAKAAWMRAMPALDDAALAADRRATFLDAMLGWWEKRPS